VIKDIREIDFPKKDGKQYATLTQATVTLQDMGEKTITSKVSIDGGIVPDFSRDWSVEFRGEKYIMPLRQPQGGKENADIHASYDLTFKHWAIYQLQQRFFFDYVTTKTGTVMMDKLEVPLQLNLRDFCDYLRDVCKYWFGDKIRVDFNDDPATGWKYSLDKSPVEISNSYIWDVLLKLYETYQVRWTIEPSRDNDNDVEDGERYVILIGYPAEEVGHIFRYGFEGGLLKVERQVQDANIRNELFGRGGSKNIPYRYFKTRDEHNTWFSPDPDFIPELADVPFTELRGATFRSYVQGWRTAHRASYEATHPGFDWRTAVNSANKAYAPWAWMRGYTDVKFNPVEFVADSFGVNDKGHEVIAGSSIAQYGELMGALSANEEIYPTIQGMEIEGQGRVDEIIDAERPETDDYREDNKVTGQKDCGQGKGATIKITKNGGSAEFVIRPTHGGFGKKSGDPYIHVPEGYHANVFIGNVSVKATFEQTSLKLTANTGAAGWGGQAPLTWEIVTENVDFDKTDELVVVESAYGVVKNVATGEEHTMAGIPPGDWAWEVRVKIKNAYDKKDLNVTPEVSHCKYIYAEDKQFGSTWDIWIKDPWGYTQGLGESDEAYASRVWNGILGDSEGNEAAVMFTTGALAASSDYEFKIVKGGFKVDRSKTIYHFADGTVATSPDDADYHGGVAQSYKSEWKLTLAKSDADLESTNKYIPSTQRFAVTGDHIVFVGIELPYRYVLEAEKRLDDCKKDELAKVKVVKPTYVVSLDNVRIYNQGKAGAIADSIRIGNSIRLQDARLVAGDYEILYIKSVTYNYKEPTTKDANLLPETEMVLADSYEVTANPVTMLSSDVTALQRQIGSLSNVEQVMRAVGDKLYLRKDGIEDVSVSPTRFASTLNSDNFRSGMIGGRGWGFYIDSNGACVFETDRLAVRQDMEVNNLVINQVSARSGMIVESAAQIKLTRVEETDDAYICYFDQKEGTVGNLFEVGDVAFCQRFTAENSTMKYYRRRIMAIGPDYITLTKGYPAVALPDGSKDTGVRGTGGPEEGDTVIQYGSYTNAERRFVKIRDVIGGGYDRYLDGLDSVNSDGTEYYFSGRQTGRYNDKPRFYVGSPNGYMEWENDKLNIKGSISVTSTFGDQSLEDYIKGAASVNKEDIESFVNAVIDPKIEGIEKQIDGVIEVWFGEEEPTLDNYPASGWDISQQILHCGDMYYNSKTGAAYRFVKVGEETKYKWEAVTGESITAALAAAGEKRRIFTEQPKPPYDVGDVWVNAHWGSQFKNDILRCVTQQGENGKFSIDHWVKASDYTDDTIANEALEGVKGLSYLSKALKDRTVIDGGLMLTSLIKLGSNNNDPLSQDTYSGISGIYDVSKKGQGIAAWYGGDMIDREIEGNGDNKKRARSLFRMNGTGYLADGQLSWNETGTLTLGNGVKVAGLNDPISESLTSFINFTQGLATMFVAEDAGGNEIKWTELASAAGLGRVSRIRVNKSLYSMGGVSALGASDDTGGGSGSGSGGGYGRLDNWADYVENSGDVLSADLGYDLKLRLDDISVNGAVTVTTAQTITGLKTFTNQMRMRSNLAFCHADTTSGIYITGDAGGGLALNAHRDWLFTASLATLSAAGRFSAKQLRSEAAQGTAPVEVSSTTVCTNLNADLLDGLHSTAFARADEDATKDLNNVNGVGIMKNDANANATTARHYPINEAGMLIYGNAAYNSSCQIYGSYDSNRWFARGGGSSTTGKTAWREFAFTDSTVAVAKRLENSVTIWGKTTNGTNNIDGHMTGVADINTAAAPARVVYLGAEHNGAAWNSGKGVVNVAVTNNTSQTPLLLAYRKGTTDMAGANRLFAMELRNNGKWLQIGFGGVQKYTLDNAGNFYAVGGVTCLSDMRFKDVKRNIELSVEDVAAAPVFVYTWKGGDCDRELAGSSAQYWEKVLPWLVPEKEGRKSMAYDKIALMSAVSAAREIVALKEKNKALRETVDALERKLDKIMEKLGRL